MLVLDVGCILLGRTRIVLSQGQEQLFVGYFPSQFVLCVSRVHVLLLSFFCCCFDSGKSCFFVFWLIELRRNKIILFCMASSAFWWCKVTYLFCGTTNFIFAGSFSFRSIITTSFKCWNSCGLVIFNFNVIGVQRVFNLSFTGFRLVIDGRAVSFVLEGVGTFGIN